MCLAIPAKIVDVLPDEMARVSLDGVTKVVSVALLDDVAVGDFVIVHVGHALARLDPEEARKTLDLLARMGAADTEG
jgi:hydrogenase expression/formation protein HypC